MVNPPVGTNTTGTTDPGAPADPAGTPHLDFHSAQWRVPVGLQMLPGVFFSILMIGVCESPRWLAGKDRKDEAIKTLAWLRCVKLDDCEDREGHDTGSDKESVAGREKGDSHTSTPAEHVPPSLARENHPSTPATPNSPHENAPTISLDPRVAAIHEEYAGIQAQLDETRGARLRELFNSANIKRFTTSTFISIFHIWTFHTGILYYA